MDIYIHVLCVLVCVCTSVCFSICLPDIFAYFAPVAVGDVSVLVGAKTFLLIFTEGMDALL